MCFSQYVVTVLLYLGPLNWGVTCHQSCYGNNNDSNDDDDDAWRPLDLLLLGGLAISASLFLLTPLIRRPRLLSIADSLQVLATASLLLAETDRAPHWISRLAAVTCGMAMGINVPAQQVRQ